MIGDGAKPGEERLGRMRLEVVDVAKHLGKRLLQYVFHSEHSANRQRQLPIDMPGEPVAVVQQQSFQGGPIPGNRTSKSVNSVTCRSSRVRVS